ncbi:TIGR01244 family phosphatase [Roseovarius faecimaris]|uniref:TIGR01244 family phosphatase n=1 Tax=Roseovarius faecimaris TaxID=2494550 RepID=A0A6I6INC0_9RHOB|nr:TIGR01244 family sulfur transferase [Roseovarius faecimaris]QGX97007.1 TIGR01244 family phosphatase [Roseovarius faecimaris]
MDLRPLSPDFAVSPQIMPEDVAAIAEAGFKSIMCNRPDGEEWGQPDVAAISEAAEKAGLELRWVPIISGMVGRDEVQAFDAAMQELPAPVLAYCRTGTRCTMMWTIVQHGRMPDADILKATSGAGYDMAGLLGQLSQQG